MQYVVLLLGLDFPAVVALIDCANRTPTQFEGGADDRAGWLRWLTVALVLCPLLVGYGIVLGYYWSVVKRTSSISSHD
jgi:hypothetical protein